VLLVSCFTEATKVITEKRRDRETLVRALLQYETLTGEKIVDRSGRNISVFDQPDNHVFMRSRPEKVGDRRGRRTITLFSIGFDP
jgi:hypothetical protein